MENGKLVGLITLTNIARTVDVDQKMIDIVERLSNMRAIERRLFERSSTLITFVRTKLESNVSVSAVSLFVKKQEACTAWKVWCSLPGGCQP